MKQFLFDYLTVVGLFLFITVAVMSQEMVQAPEDYTEPVKVELQVGRYQLVNGQKYIYRIDTTDGHVWRMLGSEWVKLTKKF